MATRFPVPGPRRKRRHQHNPQWRRDRRARPSMASLEAALAVIPNLPRTLLCRLTDRMIDRLDELDGDADAEPGGDELDGNGADDEARIQGGQA